MHNSASGESHLRGPRVRERDPRPSGRILGGLADDKGKTVFTCAHPLFWAPYSIIGDGG